jgi:hypothetical protein
MRIELTLGGSDAIKSAFRDMSAELDKLGKKLDKTQSQLNGVSDAASGFAPQSSAPTVPPVAVPPVVTPPQISVPSGSGSKKIGVQGMNLPQNNGQLVDTAIKGLAMVAPEAAVVASALVILGKAAESAAQAVRFYADFAFNARGGANAARELAGISNAAGVGLDEAAGIAASKPGGARQLRAEIDALRNMKDDEQAARYAQNRNIEGFRSVRNMNDSQYKEAQGLKGFDAGEIKAVDQAMTGLSIASTRLWHSIQKSLLPTFVIGAKVVEEFTRELDALVQLATNPIGFASDMWEKITGGQKDAAERMNQAADKQIEAANKIHDATYGGGNRARGAIPAAWGWYQDKDAINKNIRGLGSMV